MRGIILLLFFFVAYNLSVDYSHAQTVFSSTPYDAEYLVSGTNSGSGVNMTPLSTYTYKIPAGTRFNIVQVAVPESQGATSVLVNNFLRTVDDYYPWQCLYDNCENFSSTYDYKNDVSVTRVSDSAIQWNISTTTKLGVPYFQIPNDSTYYRFSLFSQPVTIQTTSLQSNAAAINAVNFTKSFDVAAIRLCYNYCDSDEFVSSPEVSYSSIYNTRFTGVSGITLATSTNTISFDVAYYIDSSELDTSNAARNITMILADYETGTSSQDLGQTGEYITPVNGNATTSMSVTSSAFANDGTYTFKVSFGNLGSQITGVYPFSETYVYFDVVVSGGVISQTIVDSPYTPLTNNSNTVYPCSLTEIYGCIVNAFRYLFLPSPTAVASLTTVLSSSTIPFVASAYESYVVTTEALQTSQNATSTLTYDFVIPEANIDVTMISASTITQGLGSAAGMFRSIALVVLVFGFLSMIVREIRGQISITGASSVVGDSYRSGSIRR